MNMFEIIQNLYTNPTSSWILDLNDDMINSVMIQKFLALEPRSMKVARVLSKFVYKMPPKMYLGCAWSLLFFDGQKMSKVPFIKYPKKNDKGEKNQCVYDKVKVHFKIGNNEIKHIKRFIDKQLELNKKEWFFFYGIEKKYWRQHNIQRIDNSAVVNVPVKRAKTLMDF
jgi:hypothetical protein